jgi:hypothetical protein
MEGTEDPQIEALCFKFKVNPNLSRILEGLLPKRFPLFANDSERSLY